MPGKQQAFSAYPSVVNDKVQDMGTLVEVAEIVQEYQNGELDIRTRGIKVFRILEVIKQIPDKLYSGAIVNYPENDDDAGNRLLMQKVVFGIKELHRMLNVSKDFRKSEDQLMSYDVAHHAGLSWKRNMSCWD